MTAISCIPRSSGMSPMRCRGCRRKFSVRWSSPASLIQRTRSSPGPGRTATACGPRSSAGRKPRLVARALDGEKYCHPVPDFTFGKFGTVALNAPRLQTWRGSFVTKAIGGYGYSGWIWETVDGRFRLAQGPKLLSIETSVPV